MFKYKISCHPARAASCEDAGSRFSLTKRDSVSRTQLTSFVLYGMTLLFCLAPSLCLANDIPTIAPKLCEIFAKAAYKAGVDVYGNEIVSADLNAPVIAAPEEIKIPLTFDLFHYLKNKPESLGQHDVPLGMLTIKGKEIYLNDKPLSQNETEKLEALCP